MEGEILPVIGANFSLDEDQEYDIILEADQSSFSGVDFMGEFEEHVAE